MEDLWTIVTVAAGPERECSSAKVKANYESYATAKKDYTPELIAEMEQSIRKSYKWVFGEEPERVATALLPIIEEDDDESADGGEWP